MIKITVSFLSLVILTACSSRSKITEHEFKPEYKPEISTEILNQRGIVASNPNYKEGYFDLMPYFLFNKNNIFNEFQGDFDNVKYKEASNINIMVGYWSKYWKFKNALVVYLALSETSKLPLKGIPISVESSKHGSFINVELKNSGLDRIQQRVLFIKELNLENKYDILNKIKDDVITVTIDGDVYHFLNPELELD